MVSHAYTFAFEGVNAREVDVQCALAPGVPAFHIVGLPDKAVAESRERVRAALASIGMALPPKRITVNLSPSDMPKSGAHFDLPIALALLAAMEVIPAEECARFAALGELTLDGELRHVSGALPAALAAYAAGRGLICPRDCGAEAALVGDAEILAPAGLISLVNHFNGRAVLTPPEAMAAPDAPPAKDLSEIKGQFKARRALEVAAAGGHNILLVGPKGSGKTSLAQCLPGLLPPLTPKEALEVCMVHSVAGLTRDGQVPRIRPFFAPHHTASTPAIVGGGPTATPGEVSLAHNGVLFMDEFAEFKTDVLEALRQPLESGRISISRARAHVVYPSRVQLFAAMNPCKCGALADPAQACSRAPVCGVDYAARLSGPLLDRIDIQMEVPALPVEELMRGPPSEPSAPVAARIREARDRQTIRFAEKDPAIRVNAEADGALLDEICATDQEGADLLETVMTKLKLSARGYVRLRRLSRTIADLAGAERVGALHIAEAAAYRRAGLLQ